MSIPGTLSCGPRGLVLLVTWVACAVYVSSNDPQTSSKEDHDCPDVTTLYANDLDLKLFRDSKYNPIYYRYLTVDVKSSFLFVGAMNRIYGLYLKNIENQSKKLEQEFRPSPDSYANCKNNGKEKTTDCQNHIRFLVRNNSAPTSNMFYMCATGAYRPIAYQLELRENNVFIQRGKPVNTIICPHDQHDNHTSLLSEGGNPGGVPALYAGSYGDFVKSRPLIYRDPIYKHNRRVSSHVVSKHWNAVLNEPQFVGSFEDRNHVYFFFREVALEYTNCGKKIYSRVARVCKNDLGGGPVIMLNEFVTLLKARLNCSIPGEFPYYFDEIQDIYKLGDMVYGLFTTNVNGLTASAICGFSLENINRAFDGPFKQGTDHSIWLPLPATEVPSKRPGNCSAVHSSDTEQQNFVSQHGMLMDKAVMHTYGRPFFYKSSCLMRKLVAIQNVAGAREMIFFTASNTGVIYKIAAWPGPSKTDTPKTYLVTKYVPLKHKQPVWSLVLHDKWIYFGTDKAVGQINIDTCDKYSKIDLCIYDPVCGWDANLGECRSNLQRNLISYKQIDLDSYKLEEAITKQVGELYTHERVSKITGSSAMLRVTYRLYISGNVLWTQNGTSVRGERHILAQDNSLVITDIRKSDEGRYRAKDNQNRTVAEYTLVVETNKEQIEQRWMRKFDQWCDEFERYQEDIRQWEKKCTSCCEESSRANIVPARGGR